MQHDPITPQTCEAYLVFPQCSRQGIASLSVTKPVFPSVPAVFPPASPTSPPLRSMCSRSVPARASPAFPLRSQCFPVFPQCSRKLPQPLPASFHSQLPQPLRYEASVLTVFPPASSASPLRSQCSRSVLASFPSRESLLCGLRSQMSKTHWKNCSKQIKLLQPCTHSLTSFVIRTRFPRL